MRSVKTVTFPSGKTLVFSIDCAWFELPKNERDIALRILDDLTASIEREVARSVASPVPASATPGGSTRDDPTRDGGAQALAQIEGQKPK